MNAPFDSAQRRSFNVCEAEFNGEDRFRDIVVGLLRDWGTSLTLSLYHEAIVSLLGGIEVVEAMLPINRDGTLLGTQRFHLVAADTALKMTAMNRDTSAFRSQLARLIRFSPLRAIHWINIAHHELAFTTIPGYR